MDGILYVLDELGRGMAQLKAEVARLSQENARLRSQLTEREPQSGEASAGPDVRADGSVPNVTSPPDPAVGTSLDC